jgi:hypothetical protein
MSDAHLKILYYYTKHNDHYVHNESPHKSAADAKNDPIYFLPPAVLNHHSFNTLFQHTGIEVNDQTQPDLRQSQICHKLR